MTHLNVEYLLFDVLGNRMSALARGFLKGAVLPRDSMSLLWFNLNGEDALTGDV
jgi:hypothetical protein